LRIAAHVPHYEIPMNRRSFLQSAAAARLLSAIVAELIAA
jgi:hypothetical protein